MLFGQRSIFLFFAEKQIRREALPCQYNMENWYGFIMSKAKDIEIKNIGMEFISDDGKKVTALQDINLSIKNGEMVALLGPSGCGKTTLLRIIADLLQPTRGEVIIGGLSPREARLMKKYGIVFQNAVLYDWRTVRKNIELPLEIGHKIKSKSEKKQIVEEMLELVGLKDFANHRPYQLSGGMQQRVSIARALALNPEILLMDEPFSALDEFTKEGLYEDILRIWRITHKTIIFVTHNIQEAAYLSDKICVLSPRPGRLSAVIDVNEDLPRPRNAKQKESETFFNLVNKIKKCFEDGLDVPEEV